MRYLANAWYVAAWSDEVTRAPLGRTILDQPVVLFRSTDGTPAALYDACSHRFAPLSLGRVVDDRLICGYHGLEFNTGGVCVRNPHGKHAVSSSMSVRPFPLTERYGLVWIWMGVPEKRDKSLLPSLPSRDNPELTWVKGRLHVGANYQLVIDNLLDLTHVEFLHPFLAAPGNSERTRFKAEQSGDEVSAIYDVTNEPVSGLFAPFWTSPDTTGDLHVHMRWTAPSNLRQDNCMCPRGSSIDKAIRIPFVHLLTPETTESTHYFWAAGRSLERENDALSQAMQVGIQDAFAKQDEPMIRAVRTRMVSNDPLVQRAALLSIDEASVRARRVLQKMLDAQADAA